MLPVTALLGEHVAAAGVERARIQVIPNGIDPVEFPESSPPPPRERVTLGFVGFVRDWHGLDTVVRAMAEPQVGPPVALLVVGEGPARTGLEALAAELGLGDRVRFTGLRPRAEIAPLINSFDIALLPASVPYASPLKLFEYMAAGRAIVAPDQPNLREVLRHGHNALLFDPARAGAMWEAVRLLASDAPLRARLGATARADVLTTPYTWEGNARRVVALFEAARR